MQNNSVHVAGGKPDGAVASQLNGSVPDDWSAKQLRIEESIIAAHQARQEQPSLTITLRQAEELVKFFGGHDCEATVTGPLSAWEKTEAGLYAYCTEYPEEGASYLGKTEVDDDLAMHGRQPLPPAIAKVESGINPNSPQAT